ncbi:hypothetical protein NOCA2120100 [metagenome]|uniref:Uncharacterized protein n=1 Tax=metagenome TaxID=256318 RepID=A0A2P2BWG1_9ZZZZ
MLDVAGVVGELPARVVVALDVPCHDPGRPVVHARAVGVEQPSEEVGRTLVDDLPLPRLEGDPAFVLATRAVLGEQARPVLPVRLNDAHAWSRHAEGRAERPNGAGQRLDVADDALIASIAADSQGRMPAVDGDRAIAQVVAEKCAIGGTGQRSPIAEGALTTHGAEWVAPRTQTGSADAQGSAYLAEVQPVVEHSPGGVPGRDGVHDRSVSEGTDKVVLRVPRVGFEPTLDGV